MVWPAQRPPERIETKEKGHLELRADVTLRDLMMVRQEMDDKMTDCRRTS